MLGPVAPDLDVIAAREAELRVIIVEPARHVDVRKEDGVLVLARPSFQGGNLCADAAANRVGQVAPDLPAGVRQSLAAVRIEQDARGLAAARRKYDRFRSRFPPPAA